MAIVMIMKWEGVTPDQYDRAREVVKWDVNPPAGGLYHVAAFDGHALRVVDTWESAEQFQQFVDQRLMPGVQQVGITGQPEVEVYPAHLILAPGYSAKQ